ncbi:MAG: RNA methyltransferase [Planctomycetota bacterium]|nr:RNA methyltransferase [Planctomycetota bacterium]
MNGPHLIQALDDPRVDSFRDVRDRDLRGRDGLFMAESELVIRRLIRQPERLHSVLLSPEKHDRLQDVLQTLPESVPVYIADLAMMGEIAGFHVHRGALATGHRPPAESLIVEHVMGALDMAQGCTLLLARGLTNVDNMGALFRNAAAFGVDAVILDDACCDPLYRKAIRVSMGHVLAVPWAIADDWIKTLQSLQSRWGVHLAAAECRPSSVSAAHMNLPERAGLVLGSEGHGLDDETLEACDAVIEIPMADGIPSLNVATASAILLWERRRQCVDAS